MVTTQNFRTRRIAQVFPTERQGHVLRSFRCPVWLLLWAMTVAVCPAQDKQTPSRREPTADSRAQQALKQLTLNEKLGLIEGYLTPLVPVANRPSDVALGVGYETGIPRLGIPSISETDAGLGVANPGGVVRPQDYATALPSGNLMASTWDADGAEQAGAMIGAEARAKGFNILLAGGVNLEREPRDGRNFEYMGEDPLLAGVLAGRLIKGVQSNHIISTIKHYALNDQETGRGGLSVNMAEAAIRESDLLAFEIAIEIGKPGSVMCGYNRINGVYACENNFLLNDVLRRDWGYKGWVMSDWGAVHSIAIRAGLDQESATRLTEKGWLGSKLRDAMAAGSVTEADVDQSALRILRSMYDLGLIDHPTKTGGAIDFEAHAKLAQGVAERGIVLLKNDDSLLPIVKTAHRIVLIGGHADVGVLAGGGSSQVNPAGGPALALSIPGEPVYHKRMYMPSSPLKSLQQLLPGATITFDDGTDVARAQAAARNADIAIVFVEQFSAEGKDLQSLSLPDDQDKLIDTVASANPHSVVVLETSGPVTMPWLSKVPAVLAAWYPGQRGGIAIARILAGEVNPSGRLPVTFPVDVDQTPNPSLPGRTIAADTTGKDLYDVPFNRQFDMTYPEGADAGYRWFERQKSIPLFAFGHGLSYTRFEYHKLSIEGGAKLSVTFQVVNVGKRDGTEIAQVYASVGGIKRLVGWSRVNLKAGESKTVSVLAEPRLLSTFDATSQKWHLSAGAYAVDVSSASDEPRLSGTAKLAERSIKP